MRQGARSEKHKPIRLTGTAPDYRNEVYRSRSSGKQTDVDVLCAHYFRKRKCENTEYTYNEPDVVFAFCYIASGTEFHSLQNPLVEVHETSSIDTNGMCSFSSLSMLCNWPQARGHRVSRAQVFADCAENPAARTTRNNSCINPGRPCETCQKDKSTRNIEIDLSFAHVSSYCPFLFFSSLCCF